MIESLKITKSNIIKNTNSDLPWQDYKLFDEVASKLYKNNFAIIDYPFIGDGEYKAVYDLGNDRVLKVALNKNGTRDNLSSVKHYNCNPDFFPVVYAYRDNGHWAVCEKVPIILKTPNVNFAQLTQNYFDFSEDEMSSQEFWSMNLKSIIRIFVKSLKDHDELGHDLPETVVNLSKNKKFIEFLYVLHSCNAGIYDLHRNNYGFRQDGQIVVIDSDETLTQIPRSVERLIRRK